MYLRLNKVLIVATATAMLFYDFTLTFDREVNLFWSKKFTGASALFFFIRYLTFAYELLDMASSLFTMSDEVRHVRSQLYRANSVFIEVRHSPCSLYYGLDTNFHTKTQLQWSRQVICRDGVLAIRTVRM